MFGRKQKISLVLFMIILILAPGTVSYAEELNLTSEAAILMDMETGQVLYEKNADLRWAPASTTKIMTALTAIQHSALDTEMTASRNAIVQIPSDYGLAGINIGEAMTLNDLLHFVLIISANEAANVIAENVSPTGEIDDFVALMNQKAQELGLKDTHFTNTYGLYEESHYSTARDLAITARKAMENPTFRSIVSKKEVPLPDTNLRKSGDWDNWHVNSTNKLLDSVSEHYTKVTGIKTGYTQKSGCCLAFSAVNSEGLELLGVILGAENYDVLFAESQQLLEYGFIHYRVTTVASSGEFFGRFEAVDAVDNIPVDLQTLGVVSHLLPTAPEKLQAEITTLETLNTPFSAPIVQGQVLGRKAWFYQGEEIGSVQLVAVNEIEKTLTAQIRDKVSELIQNNTLRNIVYILIILILLLIILRIVLKGISRRRNYHRRHYRM